MVRSGGKTKIYQDVRNGCVPIRKQSKVLPQRETGKARPLPSWQLGRGFCVREQTSGEETPRVPGEFIPAEETGMGEYRKGDRTEEERARAWYRG